MTQEEINKALKLHKLWLDNEEDGIRANMSGANMRGADMHDAIMIGANMMSANMNYANISGAIMNHAYMFGANMNYANISGAIMNHANMLGAIMNGAIMNGAIMIGADMRGVDISGAVMKGVDMSGADISNADIKCCIGNMREIKSMQIEQYAIAYTKDQLAIGCEQHSIEDWKSFSDKTIMGMDDYALEWWLKWKNILFQIIEKSPAK